MEGYGKKLQNRSFTSFRMTLEGMVCQVWERRMTFEGMECGENERRRMAYWGELAGGDGRRLGDKMRKIGDKMRKDFYCVEGEFLVK